MRTTSTNGLFFEYSSWSVGGDFETGRVGVDLAEHGLEALSCLPEALLEVRWRRDRAQQFEPAIGPALARRLLRLGEEWR